MTIRMVLLLLTIILSILSFLIPWWMASRRERIYVYAMAQGKVNGIPAGLGVIALITAGAPSVLVLVQLVRFFQESFREGWLILRNFLIFI